MWGQTLRSSGALKVIGSVAINMWPLCGQNKHVAAPRPRQNMWPLCGQDKTCGRSAAKTKHVAALRPKQNMWLLCGQNKNG